MLDPPAAPLEVLPALVNSSASSTFISSQLDLQCNDLDKLLKLQLFDGGPTMTRITQYHDNTLTLNNDLWFQAQPLITQLLPSTPIVLRLPWLQDVNPDINWKNLSITSGATQSPSTFNGDLESEENIPPPQSPLIKSQWLPPNIPQNQYKGLQYPDQQCSTLLNNSATTPDSTTTTLLPTPTNSRNLNIKIISTVPFACILQDSTSAFQLQIMPALLKEHLHKETTLPECKMEKQILYEVVPLEYHEFTDMFSEGSAKELPPHHSYDHKIDLEEDALPLFGKIYNMSESKLWALKEYLNNMLGKGFICPLISAASALVLFSKLPRRRTDHSDSV
ncbi:hypothetical protein E4T56_gene15915 [Termitomyces sp. T112]|nr:hypothetical protein E4T56_gene15915 [Termitomyces sp. T112]